MEPFSPSHSCSFLNWELMIIMKKPFVMFFNKILYWPLSTQVKVRVLGILFASSFTFSLPYSLPLFLSLFSFLLLAHLNRQRDDVGANGNGIVARRNGEIVGDAFSVFYHACVISFVYISWFKISKWFIDPRFSNWIFEDSNLFILWFRIYTSFVFSKCLMPLLPRRHRVVSVWIPLYNRICISQLN